MRSFSQSPSPMYSHEGCIVYALVGQCCLLLFCFPCAEFPLHAMSCMHLTVSRLLYKNTAHGGDGVRVLHLILYHTAAHKKVWHSQEWDEWWKFSCDVLQILCSFISKGIRSSQARRSERELHTVSLAVTATIEYIPLESCKYERGTAGQRVLKYLHIISLF